MPDHQHVLTGSDDGMVRLWRFDGGECVQEFAHESPVSDVSCSSNGELLLTLSNGSIKVWESSSGTCVWKRENVYVLQAFFIPQTEDFVSIADESPKILGLEDGSEQETKIWNLRCANPMVLEGHSAVVLSAVCSKDGNRLVTGSLDRSVRLWQRIQENWTCLRSMYGHFDAVRAIAIGCHQVASASGVTARVWCTETGNCDLVINDHAGSIHCMQFSNDGQRLLVAYGCGREVMFNWTSSCSGLKLWCINTKTCLASIETGDFILFAHLLENHSILFACPKRIEMWQSRDQWLDWALIGPIYRRLTGKEPGSSQKIGGEEEEDGDDEEASDEED
eukprot:symbB.v1.2.031335.t1/scaffold3624.1/size53936/5